MSLTPKQDQFWKEYVLDFNATQASIRAGYSVKTAAAIGWENLRKPDIRKKIDEYLSEASLSKTETIKQISDIAKSDLNGYMVIKTVPRSDYIEVSLKKIIQNIRFQIEDAQKLFKRSGKKTKEQTKAYNEQQASRETEIIKLEIELERNPRATRIIAGPEKLVEVAELDLAKLVKDKENGARIKSIVPTEHGTKVETYSADGALRDMARIHDAFKKDNKREIEATITPPDLSGLTTEELEVYMRLSKKAQGL